MAGWELAPSGRTALCPGVSTGKGIPALTQTGAKTFTWPISAEISCVSKGPGSLRCSREWALCLCCVSGSFGQVIFVKLWGFLSLTASCVAVSTIYLCLWFSAFGRIARSWIRKVSINALTRETFPMPTCKLVLCYGVNFPLEKEGKTD